MPLTRVAVDGTDPVRFRAASTLLADPRVDRVGLIGRKPPAAWGSRAVAITSANGWDVTVGTDVAPPTPDVTVGPGGAVPWAGPTGLARVLGVRLGAGSALAGTVVGDPIHSGPRFGFPPPLGWLHGRPVEGIHHCPVRGSVAGVMATQPDGASLVVVDDRQFLDGVLLAAGVLLASGGHRGPVWEAAADYLDLIVELGLVLADRA
jgi:hypothetical protein